MVLRITTPVCCVLDGSPECTVPLQPHPPTLREVFARSFHPLVTQSSQLIRGNATVSSNPLNVLRRVPGSLCGLLVVVSLFSAPSGVSGGTWVGCSAPLLGLNPGEGCALADRFHLPLTLGGRRPRGGGEGGGFGGGGSWRPPRPGSGPRPRRARSAVLPRSSPMLIFGLGCPCPGISRHASCRPVRRPEPGREGGRERGSDGGGGGGGGSPALPCAHGGPSRAPSRSASAFGWPRLRRGEPRSQVSSGSFAASPPPSHPSPAELRCDPDP